MPILFTRHLKDEKIEERETLVLKCRLNTPNVPVKWLKDGVEIVKEERIHFEDGQCDHCLHIKDVCIKDNGTYTCVYEDIESRCTVQITEPPAVFTEELQDKIVKEKDTLKLRCKLNEPDVSVLWFKDGRTSRRSVSDGRIPSTYLQIAITICAVLIPCLINYFVRPPIFEKDLLEQRLADIEAITHQKADKRSVTDIVHEYTQGWQHKQETELQSLKSKLRGVENDVLSKADNTKLEDLVSQFDKKFKEIEESFCKRVENMDKLLNEKVEAFKNDLENDTKASLRVFKQEAIQNISSIRAAVSYVTETLGHDFKTKLDEVSDQMTAIKKAKKEADGILEDIKGDLRKIMPNTFNKEALTTAFLALTVIVFFLALWIYRVQTRLSTGGLEPNRSMNAADVLQQIPTRVTLGNSVCIVSFDEARQTAHETLVFSAFLTVQNVQVEYYVVRRHEQLRRLPKCKLYIMCTEFSERHVIIEEPGLGLGDLKRCTYETIQRYGAQMIILYTRDPGSRNLGDNLYNPRIHCVSSQPELSSLRDLGRFLSTYDELTENQKQSLNDTIAQCLQ